jgi:DTW domain-containing protein YfiP
MHQSLCVCALIPRLETRTRLVLVIHRTEERKPTNTGVLAAECLVNSEVIVRGHAAQPSQELTLQEGMQPVLLFPHEDAVNIVDFMKPTLPVTLIVPDGTWRQASKVRNRVPGLLGIPCVSLGPGEPSIYRLRAEAHAHGLATIEAIARAFGVLEGPHVRKAMEYVFRSMVERTLWARGGVATEQVTGGIPTGVMRHDPRSGQRDAPR